MNGIKETTKFILCCNDKSIKIDGATVSANVKKLQIESKDELMAKLLWLGVREPEMRRVDSWISTSSPVKVFSVTESIIVKRVGSKSKTSGETKKVSHKPLLANNNDVCRILKESRGKPVQNRIIFFSDSTLKLWIDINYNALCIMAQRLNGDGTQLLAPVAMYFQDGEPMYNSRLVIGGTPLRKLKSLYKAIVARGADAGYVWITTVY